jgi:LacI family transcriptional regulator
MATKKTTSVTIKDVAQLSGVSPMTVSRVINVSQRVSPETRRRVEEAISELGYVPSRLARGFSRQRTGTLALIVPDVANPFFTAIVRAAEDVARRAGYRIILCDTRGDLSIEREVIEEMIAHRVEGIVIAPVSDRSKGHLLRLAKFGVPFVLRPDAPGIELDAILGDVVALSARRASDLAGPPLDRFTVESDASDRRTAGILRVRLLAAGVRSIQPLSPRPRSTRAGFSMQPSSRGSPTAVFTVNTLVAPATRRCARPARGPRAMGLSASTTSARLATQPFLTVMGNRE